MAQPLAQRAVFLCKSESFQRWIDRKLGLLDRTTDEIGAALWLRKELGIRSRSELKPGSIAAQRFASAEKTYRSEVVAMGFPDDPDHGF